MNAAVDGLSPREFEMLVASYLRGVGFDAQLTRATADGGIDIIATRADPILAGKYIVQCKQWDRPVGEEVVRDLYGTVTAERANKGILITTSTYTNQARAFAEGKPIELIDGGLLAQLLESSERQELLGERPVFGGPWTRKWYVDPVRVLFEELQLYSDRVQRELDGLARQHGAACRLDEAQYRDYLNKNLWARIEITTTPTEDVIALGEAFRECAGLAQRAVDGEDTYEEYRARVVAPARIYVFESKAQVRGMLDLCREAQGIMPPPKYSLVHAYVLEEQRLEIREALQGCLSWLASICGMVGAWMFPDEVRNRLDKEEDQLQHRLNEIRMRMAIVRREVGLVEPAAGSDSGLCG